MNAGLQSIGIAIAQGGVWTVWAFTSDVADDNREPHGAVTWQGAAWSQAQPLAAGGHLLPSGLEFLACARKHAPAPTPNHEQVHVTACSSDRPGNAFLCAQSATKTLSCAKQCLSQAHDCMRCQWQAHAQGPL